MGLPTPADDREQRLALLLQQGEGPSLEFKRSTGELKEAMRSLCAFANGAGGTVLFGVGPEGDAAGQKVSDQTLRDISQAAQRFEPPVHLHIWRAQAAAGLEIVAAACESGKDSGPHTYDGRAYERVGSATRRMPQTRYERLLLDRAHGRNRWENAPAVGVLPGHLDRDQALRLARFRGVDKTEFLDQRQLRGPAFKLLEEAELFCQRHFPLPGKIVPGRLQRVDTPLIPPDAMREILVNALIHRDYSIAGGAVSLAIFDDRVEVWSAGTYPSGITPDMLAGSHQSVQRNPIIADIFFRAGLIEKWGRGTNRVIAMCREAGIAPPSFQEISGAALVTFRVKVAEPTAQVTGQVTGQVAGQVTGQVLRYCQTPRKAIEIQRTLRLRHRETFQDNYLKPLLAKGWLARTIPQKPHSRLQKYLATEAGRKALADARPGNSEEIQT
ncbi:MAG: putative DNA binding domain-containing protein [Elusimicrobia bacterium]|nr:putative DNA binding domain-containing protein [Elusimicrobiota bacterium]